MCKSILVGTKENVARMRKAVEQRAVEAALDKAKPRIATFNHSWVLGNK